MSADPKVLQFVDAIYASALDAEKWLMLDESLDAITDNGTNTDILTQENAFLEMQFERAFSIADEILTLNEDKALLSETLDSFNFGVSFWDDEGALIYANREFQAQINTSFNNDQNSEFRLYSAKHLKSEIASNWVKKFKDKNSILELRTSLAKENNRIVLIPRPVGEDFKFPIRAACAMIWNNQNAEERVKRYGARLGLSDHETKLITNLFEHHNLRKAAQKSGITYESSRTYLKRIFSKTGVLNQQDLYRNIFMDDTGLFKSSDQNNETPSPRKIFKLSSGKKIEAFVVGPKTGTPVIVMVGNVDCIFNVLEKTKEISTILNTLGIRVIMPQWPGTYQSDPEDRTYSYKEFSFNIFEIMQSLGYEKFSILSHSYSSTVALSICCYFPENVENCVLASAYDPFYNTQIKKQGLAYRLAYDLDVRKSWVGERILGLMWRCAAHDPSISARMMARETSCTADIDFLMRRDKQIEEKELIKKRTAQGFRGQVHRSVDRLRVHNLPLYSITTNIEIYNGSADDMTPFAGAQFLASKLQNATTQCIAEAGHFFFENNWRWLLIRAAGNSIKGPKRVITAYPAAM